MSHQVYDEESSAIVACDGNGRGCVLWWVGEPLQNEIEGAGLHDLGDLGLDDAPLGISVWEGNYLWSPGPWEHPDDGEMDARGAFRKPTDAEWLAIHEGKKSIPMSQFKIGDEVTWTSQSAGRTKTKTGRVVEIVLPGSVPRLKGHGGKRDHTSYLVRASGRLYWPRVSHLALTQVVVLQEKLGGIISDGTTGAICLTCGKDLANPGQWIRCREHHVAEIHKQAEAIKTLQAKIQELELHHAQHHHDEDNAQGNYEDLEKKLAESEQACALVARELERSQTCIACGACLQPGTQPYCMDTCSPDEDTEESDALLDAHKLIASLPESVRAKMGEKT